MSVIVRGFNPEQVRLEQAKRIAQAAVEAVTSSAPGMAFLPVEEPHSEALARLYQAAGILAEKALIEKAARILNRPADPPAA